MAKEVKRKSEFGAFKREEQKRIRTEATKQKMLSKEERQKKKTYFLRNASLIIDEMKKMVIDPKHHSELLDELLHSIFFLGLINDESCTPEEIVNDTIMLKELKDCYLWPFKLCFSQLPKRSPMSCVLDMIVKDIGQENEDQIREKLQELILKLKQDEVMDLVSSTICVSQANPKVKDSVRYYGVSMSTSGSNPGKIMIAASCLSAWDSYVAGAVMTYYPEKEKMTDFDGTIKLPDTVRCEAFSLTKGTKKDPCISCQNLFGLTPKKEEKKEKWVYGHCAEVESVSNLLKNEIEVRQTVQQTSENCKDANRQKAEDTLSKVLKDLLGKLRTQHTQPISFNWDDKFYTQQRVSSKKE